MAPNPTTKLSDPPIHVDENPASSSSSSSSEYQIARDRLRSRWELASVLNFLKVFGPVIKSELVLTAEEIETGLISPNKDLADLHIAILKGIPPVSKLLPSSDAWVPAVRKKLSTWWNWLAEGDNPLVANHGEEVTEYKKFDPIVRLQILKALCELRAIQEDASRYINDAMKSGSSITIFRKESIGEDSKGTAYWYDGDTIIGHRLYKEITNMVEYMKAKGRAKGQVTQPTNSSQWETIATNLEEFQQISNKFSSKKIPVEAVVKMVANEILPVLEEVQKRKEMALKRQQRQALRLTSYLNSYEVARTRTCRDRKPVTYTFDDYDRRIDEALNSDTIAARARKRGDVRKDIASNGVSQNNGHGESGSEEGDFDEDNKLRGVAGGDESNDDDYNNKGDEDDDMDDENESNFDHSEKENDNNADNIRRLTRGSQKRKAIAAEYIAGVRRSSRLTAPDVNKSRNKSPPNTLEAISSESGEETMSDNTEIGTSEDKEQKSVAALGGTSKEREKDDNSENDENNGSISEKDDSPESGTEVQNVSKSDKDDSSDAESK